MVFLFEKFLTDVKYLCKSRKKQRENMASESEVSSVQNEKQNKTNMGPQDKANGQNPQNKKKDQAQNKSSRPEQY